MHIITTVVPIFVIIVLGWLARLYGFMRPEFLNQANRLVFYLAIPAMVFRSISKTSLTRQVNETIVFLALLAVFLVFCFAWILAGIARVHRNQRGTFIQNSIHGNVGYIGLAVSYYYLGSDGFVRASILAGFMMIFQNLLGVIALKVFSENNSVTPQRWTVALKILGNPIILSALAGILVSMTGLPVPVVLGRCLDILGDLALPMALLIIGASLSFGMVNSRLMTTLAVGVMKLILLPGIGYLIYRMCGVVSDAYLPAIILLATPTATVTYVMAKEMKGDSELAVATISLSTLLSALTFALWLNIVGLK